ncbi:hypothetical protein QYM36_001181 [Artemia franciscana]|uniref:Uncharacterized protein n=1 Tax=Artemia franciscana TaxID=6661 RepID=A0AA88I5P2_ARTSF|nr:hypothetical protein QYM36_001181 [Artemia franciscana]
MPENAVCYRCEKGPHKPSDCYFRNAECQKKENIAAACRSKPDSVARKEKRKCKVRHVAETEKSEEEKTNSASPPDLKQIINKDNWTILSISEQTYRNYLSSVKLKKCEWKLVAYGGHDIPIFGEANVKVTHKSQSKTLPLIVAAGNGPSLFGRNWLREIKLDWNMIKAVKRMPDIKP